MAVIGAGIAGCAAAIVLQRAGAAVHLFESGRRRDPAIGETLPGAARPLLRRLGLWDAFCAEDFLPAWGTVAAWGSPVPVVGDAILDPHGHGWQVARERFGALLRRSALAAGARPIAHGLAAAGRRNGQWHLHTTSAAAESVSVDFVIDATGRSSGFARLVGSRRVQVDDLVCRSARFGGAGALTDVDTRTWIEACPGGWWYTARVPGAERVFAFLTDGDLLAADTHEANGFRAWLEKTYFMHRFVDQHGLRLVRGPDTGVARTSRLIEPVGEAWLAVGDAALAFDPIAGQGMLTALVTGTSGAEAVLNGTGAYRLQLETIWQTFLNSRTASYASEERWPKAEFWARRSLDALVPAGATRVGGR